MYLRGAPLFTFLLRVLGALPPQPTDSPPRPVGRSPQTSTWTACRFTRLLSSCVHLWSGGFAAATCDLRPTVVTHGMHTGSATGFTRAVELWAVRETRAVSAPHPHGPFRPRHEWTSGLSVGALRVGTRLRRTWRRNGRRQQTILGRPKRSTSSSSAAHHFVPRLHRSTTDLTPCRNLAGRSKVSSSRESAEELRVGRRSDVSVAKGRPSGLCKEIRPATVWHLPFRGLLSIFHAQDASHQLPSSPSSRPQMASRNF